MNNNEIIVSAVLKQLGVSLGISGYRYLKSAIVTQLENPERIGIYHISKEVYPLIAKKFKTTAARVERAMRHSIESAFTDRGDHELQDEIFRFSISENKGKPTNTEFISTVAEWIHLNRNIIVIREKVINA